MLILFNWTKYKIAFILYKLCSAKLVLAITGCVSTLDSLLVAIQLPLIKASDNNPPPYYIQCALFSPWIK